MHLAFQDVTFHYSSFAEPVFGALSLNLAPGFSGVIGPNGAGKTTLLRLAVGELEPDEGRVLRPSPAIYCPQRTDDPPAGFEELLCSPDRVARVLVGRLGIGEDWPERWSTLSHGERKRAQIAAALRQEPSLLCIDEPTNHIDREARDLLIGALRSYRGIGLLVSHDRDLLDTLCRQCLFVGEDAVAVRPGGYTKATETLEQERAAAAEAARSAKKELARLRKAKAKRAQEAAQADRKRSKRGIDSKDHDAKARVDLARFSGKDAKAAELMNQLSGRVRHAEEKASAAQVGKERRMGIHLQGEASRANVLLGAPGGELDLGGGVPLRFPELTIRPDVRIGVTGPNGAGKSTLLRHLLSLGRLPAGRVVYLAQEVGREEAAEVLHEVRRLPKDERGRVLGVVSRLGSDPERVLETVQPSPGETRKLVLALGMSRSPHLIVMDEPTNHLDLPSIECLEAALADCSASLLLVSHDERFLDRLTSKRWELARSGDGYELRIC